MILLELGVLALYTHTRPPTPGRRNRRHIHPLRGAARAGLSLKLLLSHGQPKVSALTSVCPAPPLVLVSALRKIRLAAAPRKPQRRKTFSP
jgi:hypothetical protein